MRMRLIQDSLIMTIFPILSILLLSQLYGYSSLSLAVVIVATLGQIVVVFLCRRDAIRMIHPSAELLQGLGVEHVPVPFEPGKFRIDFKVFGCFIWLGCASPALFLIAQNLREPPAARLALQQAETLGAPHMELALVAVFLILYGALCLPLWSKIGQSMVIANEGSDRKRYLYQGFAEQADDSIPFCRYWNLSAHR